MVTEYYRTLDRETGLYYFGARYLDPRTSRWLSTDPAMWEGDYIPRPGQGSRGLGGIGGVFNIVNLHVYHYAANNPVKYIDPDGRQSQPSIFSHGNYMHGHGQRNRFLRLIPMTWMESPAPMASLADRVLMSTTDTISNNGPCYMMALMGVAQTFVGRNLTANEVTGLMASLTGNPNLVRMENPPYYVQDPRGIIVEALGVLEPGSRFTVDIVGSNDPNLAQIRDNIVGSLLHVGGLHWQEGDRAGNFRWDPYDGTGAYYQGEAINQRRFVIIQRLPD